MIYDELHHVIGRYSHLLPHEIEAEFRRNPRFSDSYIQRTNDNYHLRYGFQGAFDERLTFRLRLPELMILTEGHKKMLPPFERYDDCSYVRVGLYLQVVAVLQGAQPHQGPKLIVHWRPAPNERQQEFKFNPALADLLLRDQGLRYETRSQKQARLSREKPLPIGEGQQSLF